MNVIRVLLFFCLFFLGKLPLVKGAEMQPVTCPSFSVRGVIEGFYGQPWSHEARLEMIEFIGKHRMNLYIYAPKDDPLHRGKWRGKYSPDDEQKFKELIDAGKKNSVDIGFTLSPGLTIRYSSESDFEKLLQKYKDMAELGFSIFGILLDDIPKELKYEEDKKSYPDLAAAHSEFVNKLYRRLREYSLEIKLIFCPTFYCNKHGNKKYWKFIGENLDPGISIFWTGPSVCSEEIKDEEAEEISQFLRRKVLVWDNYPVNDYCRGRLYLAPVEGRSGNLPEYIEGFLANPMNETETSKIVLCTMADYMWDAANYDPEKSHRLALLEITGGDRKAVKVLKKFTREFGAYLGPRFGKKISDPAELSLEKQEKLLKSKIKAAKKLLEKTEKHIDNPCLKKELMDNLSNIISFEQCNCWEWSLYKKWETADTAKKKEILKELHP